jgi:hypothetical protein
MRPLSGGDPALVERSLSNVDRQSPIGQSIRAMRQACRTFLDRTSPLTRDHGHMNFDQLPPPEQWRFATALAELRVVFGVFSHSYRSHTGLMSRSSW